jgi:arginase family enzyme
VRLTPSRITDAFARIETAAKRTHDAGVIPVTMGGDGSVSAATARCCQPVRRNGQSLGYNIITLREFFARGFAEVLAELRERLKGRPVYLCFDMDVFDPSCAPGVATPSWGGLSAREGIGFLRGLSVSISLRST